MSPLAGVNVSPSLASMSPLRSPNVAFVSPCRGVGVSPLSSPSSSPCSISRGVFVSPLPMSPLMKATCTVYLLEDLPFPAMREMYPFSMRVGMILCTWRSWRRETSAINARVG
jgi:hypothetical protein